MSCRIKVRTINSKLSFGWIDRTLARSIIAFLSLSLQLFFTRPCLSQTSAHEKSCPALEDSECSFRQKMGPFGVVVVGIGRAGGAHVRNLQNLPQDYPTLLSLKLIGYVSRRKLDLPIPQMTLDEAVARSDVHAVIVSTEPSNHEEVIRKSLNAGKHVMVDYPVVPKFSIAKELFSLAAEKGLILHEENIGLLTMKLKKLKEEVQKKTPLKEGFLTSHSYFIGWLEKFEENGYPFTVQQGLIKYMMYLFGDLTPVGGQLITNEKGYVATGNVKTKDNKDITLTIHLTKEPLRWGKDYLLKFEDGSVIDKEPEVSQMTETGLGLFMEDLLHFAEKLTGKRDIHELDTIALRTLEIAEGIQKNFSV